MKNNPTGYEPVILTDELFRADIVRWLPDARVGTFSTSPEGARHQIRQWREAGYQQFILLFNPEETPSENLVVTDHLNLTHNNPLIGIHEDIFGPRFPDMSNVYTTDKTPGEEVVVVMGYHKGLETFREKVWPIRAGVYDAIALKASGATVRGWLVSQLEELYSEILNLTEELCNEEA
ncbi:MAG: hypothetical protein K9N34_01640 [Candidatus Marinimicrobia bacterium]|nr:hypothetical protein [Candidatus Neomarinimicrobiota bacterium]MCF7839346.1 hypothetical protein [Candidatus Neomarinimicrobiota bacterium]MCF7902172.1 hypothetical protein [Candidatus Neomarinimicrobiota bacterium]